MHDIAIPDTSCLILLQKCDKINLLFDLYSKIIITPEIQQEFMEELPNWIKVAPVSDKRVSQVLTSQLDPGEASAIALSFEIKDSILFLDDLKARKIASQLKIPFSGTLGILHKAKKAGIITEVKPVIQMLLENGYRISENLIIDFLKMNNEL